MTGKQPIALPPKYYLDYYRYILSVVEENYASLLTAEELSYFSHFKSLSEEGQCLYLRLTTRRGYFFRSSKLNYDEVPNTSATVKELEEKGFVHSVDDSVEEYAQEVYSNFTKGELLSALKDLEGYEKEHAKLKKPALMELLVTDFSFTELLPLLTNSDELILQAKLEEEEFSRYLFFGNLYGSITDFVVRDVGNRKHESFDEKQFSRYFRSRAEIDDKLKVLRLNRDINYLLELAAAESVYEFFKEQTADYGQLTERALSSWSHLCNKLARQLEREGELELALELYPQTIAPPSRERQIRILTKLKRTDEAVSLAREIEAASQNADELYFAKDYIAKQENKLQKRVVKSTTKQLNRAASITISNKWEYNVEEGTLDYYKKEKYKGFFSENRLWKSLFGLLLWPVLYDQAEGAIHQPLQLLPSDLKTKDFYKRRYTAIEKQLELLDKSRSFKKELQQRYDEKDGIHNSLIFWDPSVIDMITTLRRKVGAEPMKMVIRKMCEDFRNNSKGFPDLLVYNRKEVMFVEVKSTNDHLSEQQLFWQDFFNHNGIPAIILRVHYSES